MHKFKIFIFIALFTTLILHGCKEYSSLDSITISPVTSDSSDSIASDYYVCDSGGDQLRQFKVTGTYDDDDTEDLSSEVTWEADSSGDAYLSDTIPGLIRCPTNIGLFGISVTYSIDNGEGEEGGGTTEFTDTAIIKGK